MLSPIVSSTLQATTIASAANIIAQLLEQHKRNAPLAISAPVFIRFLIFTLLTTPPNFLWQCALEHFFPSRKPIDETKSALPRCEFQEQISLVDEEQEVETSTELDWKNTMIKWFIDCITIGALLNTAAFLIIMGFLKSRSLGEIATALRTELFPIIIASYKIWPLASVVNFALIPVEKRIVFLSAVGLVWGVYLSLTAIKQ